MPRRHPLSLHDERGERRAKGRGETHLDGFSSPFGNPHLFRKSRNASARQARGVSRLRVRKGSSRDDGIFELKRQRRGNYLDAIENISASGANREHSSGRCPVSRESRCVIVSVSPRAFMRGGEPRAVEGRGDFKGERETAPNGFPLSFDASLVTFVAKRKLPPAA